ncbi:hypothetical protein U5N28_19150 [Lysinibacillus telephonicus]|uniref:LpxD N-terminal domain-containing protein n=1 Tax=Lysinibacillus telephonicus TaxID=1714840 RepID=UPI0039792CFA
MKLSEIAFQQLDIVRDGEFRNLGHCILTEIEDLLTFVDSEKYLESLHNQSISCVITKKAFLKNVPDNLGVIISENPRILFFLIHNSLSFKSKQETKISDDAKISKTAIISPENVKIGKRVIIEDFVVINENVEINDDTIIRAGCKIGGDGYEFKRLNSEILKVNHYGKVVIGSNVEIKENCSIHKALFDWDSTRIGDYCKIDSQTHIAHATKIGRGVMIGANCSIAGNTIIEDNVYLGPQVTISNRIRVGNGSKISLGSVVTKNIPSKSIFSGNFAIEHDKFIEFIKNLSK